MEAVWTPIEVLSEEELSVDVAEFESLAAAWEDARTSLEQDSASALERFREEVRRSWSVETGILENLYMLDRGATLTMIDRGFHQELINRASADMDPTRLIAILKDHLEASDMLQAEVQQGSRLTAHFIRQLQALITRHQESTEGVDTLGNPVRVETLRGKWKMNPNWRERESGERLPYCPPEQVEGQVDDLLAYLELQEDVNVAILAAWLHHRFSLIHPFQDGNGRVARALVNYLFLKSDLFPVVIDRDEKAEYLDALESADRGNLEPLVALLATRQISAIKQALSIARGEDIEKSAKVKDLAAGILHRAERRRQREQVQYREVNGVVEKTWEYAVQSLQRQLDEFTQKLIQGGMQVSSDVDKGGSFDDRSHYYRWEFVESARQARKWANFEEESRWIRALVEDRSTRLRFLLSFHHIGRELTGVAEATAIADLQGLSGGQESDEVPESRAGVHCMVKPFSFTWRDEPVALKRRFESWLEECFLVALRAWSDAL